jgi:hypothetical protein
VLAPVRVLPQRRRVALVGRGLDAHLPVVGVPAGEAVGRGLPRRHRVVAGLGDEVDPEVVAGRGVPQVDGVAASAGSPPSRAGARSTTPGWATCRAPSSPGPPQDGRRPQPAPRSSAGLVVVDGWSSSAPPRWWWCGRGGRRGRVVPGAVVVGGPCRRRRGRRGVVVVVPVASVSVSPSRPAMRVASRAPRASRATMAPRRRRSPLAPACGAPLERRATARDGAGRADAAGRSEGSTRGGEGAPPPPPCRPGRPR